ncbi:MAG: hypothetical protein ACREA1_02920 [Nitrosotalea sp.]
MFNFSTGEPQWAQKLSTSSYLYLPHVVQKDISGVYYTCPTLINMVLREWFDIRYALLDTITN